MRRSIRTRLLVGYLGVAALLALTWGLTAAGSNALRASYTRTVTVDDQLSNLVLQRIKLSDDEETGLRGYLLTGRAEFLQPYNSALQQLPPLRHRSEELAARDPAAGLAPYLVAMRLRSAEWNRWARQVVRRPGALLGRSGAAIAQQYVGKRLFDSYRAASARVTARIDARRQRSLDDSVAALGTVNILLDLLFAGAVLSLAAIGWRTTRAVALPLERLERVAATIGGGDLARPVAVDGAAEFQRLAASMDRMRLRIAEQHATAGARAAELAAVIEQMPSGVIVVDGDGRVKVMNEVARRLRGDRLDLARAVAAQSDIYHLRDAQSGEPLLPDQTPLGQALAGATVQNLEFVCRRPSDEEDSTWQASARPLYDEGHIDGAVSVFSDVTRERRMMRDLASSAEALRLREERLRASNQELERSNAELQQFAYVASHDLQEPLRTITSYTQLLRRRYQGTLDADADTFIGYAVEGAARMQTLIQDLLAYSRVGARAQELAPTSLGAVVDGACANLRAAVEERGATVTYDDLPTIAADPGTLGQLFQNLIGNALKFCPPGRTPHITISARLQDREDGKNREDGQDREDREDREDRMWAISVQDNGIGLDPAYKERVFVIFQRLHTREEYPGTGIGLAICKRIVERHGGRIWVESQPGEGTTFTFTLPAIAGGAGDAGDIEQDGRAA